MKTKEQEIENLRSTHHKCRCTDLDKLWKDAFNNGIQSERKRVCEIIEKIYGYNWNEMSGLITTKKGFIDRKELLAKINSEKTA